MSSPFPFCRSLRGTGGTPAARPPLPKPWLISPTSLIRLPTRGRSIVCCRRLIWRNRPARERWLIGVPVVALAGVVLYVAVLEPLAQSTARLSRILPELEARNQLIKAQTGEVRAQPVAAQVAAVKPANAAAIIPLVQSATERQQLRGASPAIERADDNRVRVVVARAPFHAMWPLLQDLQKQSGIRVVAMRVDRIDAGHARFEATVSAADVPR